MRNLTISLGQMNIAFGDPQTNLEQVRTWTAEAYRRGSSLILFPELWSTGCDWEHLDELATPLGAGTFADMADRYCLQNVGNPITHIYFFDSQDGYPRQDFNPDAGTTICEENDFVPGGDCDPTVIIGVEGDELLGDSGLTHARQFKIGYPVLDNWT